MPLMDQSKHHPGINLTHERRKRLRNLKSTVWKTLVRSHDFQNHCNPYSFLLIFNCHLLTIEFVCVQNTLLSNDKQIKCHFLRFALANHHLCPNYLSHLCRYSNGLQPKWSFTYLPKKLVLGKPKRWLISFTR